MFIRWVFFCMYYEEWYIYRWKKKMILNILKVGCVVFFNLLVYLMIIIF